MIRLLNKNGLIIANDPHLVFANAALLAQATAGQSKIKG
jgi:hypothetical protein